MSKDTVEAIARWQNSLGSKDPLEITFHGGEPLVPGESFYRMALPLLRRCLEPRKTGFTLQSNLWLLTEELCEIFRNMGVSLSTSLDGPEAVNDSQRGKGSFRRTMAGIELARTHGLSVGCICTFTAQSAPQADEVFNFFVAEGLPFSVHAALPAFGVNTGDKWTLPPSAYGLLLVHLLERYLTNLDRIRIATLDSMCRSVSSNCGGICTFTDCLGSYLSVGPDGGIYACQRFVGRTDFRMGDVQREPSAKTLSASPPWRLFQNWQNQIREECRNCAHESYCRGGCPFNALAVGRGTESTDSAIGHPFRDPYCEAYRRFFEHVADRAMEEVFTEDNLQAVVNDPKPQSGLLRRGKLLTLMHDGPHPYQTAANARQVLAAVALAATGDPIQAAHRFALIGLAPQLVHTKRAMRFLHQRLTTPDPCLHKLYLHVTFDCPLHCSHCYARGGEARKGHFSVEDLRRACGEASTLGFKQAVITGGEPLVHPQRDEILEALHALRMDVKPMQTVLRTSLALPMDADLLERVSRSTDRTVVSVDGDRRTHEARRGPGSYGLTLGNLHKLMKLCGPTRVSLSAVLPLAQVNGAPGFAVRRLAQKWGIRMGFRPVLPLGRATDAGLDILPDTLWGYFEPQEMKAYGFVPTASCGLGQNLYVEPDGAASPCYACQSKDWHLGRINCEGGLSEIIYHPKFQDLRVCTVNTNRVCRNCILRYLCGGACRAWNRQADQIRIDLDAAPKDCAPHKARALSLLSAAMDHLGVSIETWSSAGLPLPDTAI